ncbi:MAG: hypothetical protein WBK48_06615, partial [Dethiobacteria bacterium]
MRILLLKDSKQLVSPALMDSAKQAVEAKGMAEQAVARAASTWGGPVCLAPAGEPFLLPLVWAFYISTPRA